MKVSKRQSIFSRSTLVQFTHSIRFKLVLWFVLILALILLIFSAFIYWRQSNDLHSFALVQLNYTLERYLGPAHEHDESGDSAQSLTTGITGTALGANVDLLEDHVAALQATDGAIQQSVGVLTSQQISRLNLPLVGWSGVSQVTIPRTANVESKQYLFIDQPLRQNEQITGYLLVGVPLDPNNQLGRLLISLVIGSLLTLAIAFLGGFWLADQAMRPVHTITHTARQISETDLHKRLHLGGDDELTELANTFDEMLDRLQAAFERQRQFTADASHELRTPLTIIDLETSRALSSRRSVDEYERIFRTVKSENQFMIRLVNNLLALARMDAGQVSLKMEPLDLGDITLEVVERMRPLADAQGVTLTIGDMPEIPLRGDHPTLVQLLTNLVENAIKYSSPVTAPLVEITAGRRQQAGQDQAWVRVSDNGPGIPPEHLAHIFDRFYQVEAARSRLNEQENGSEGIESSGTGLGLAIAQWIAQAHHGEIRVESTVGHGSAFEVVLPA